jgi:hypothetical protein
MAKHHPIVMRIRWVYLAALILALPLAVLLAAPSPALAQDSPSTCKPSGNDNDLLYCVWLVEPRFGGMSVDQSHANVLRVLLTGDEPTDEAAARVLAEVNRLWNREFTRTTVATADYTIGQLKGWFDTVAADFHEKMTGVDLDEYANRITVMVADLDADRDTVSEHVAGLGVPDEAVQFEEFQLLPPDPVPAAQTSGSSSVAGQRLTADLDPFVGGGEIASFPNVFLQQCTASFNVMFVDQDYRLRTGFVTAGHCGDGQDDITFWTPRSDTPFPSFPYEKYAVSVWNQFSHGVDAGYLKKLPGQSIPLGYGLIARPMTENTSGGNASRAQLTLETGPESPGWGVELRQ